MLSLAALFIFCTKGFMSPLPCLPGTAIDCLFQFFRVEAFFPEFK